MKQLFLIAFLMIGGFTISASFAQTCKPANCKPSDCKPADCKICPPGCCVQTCKPGAAASATPTGTASAEVVFAAMMTDSSFIGFDPANMTRKEKKACITACQKMAAENTTNGATACTTVKTAGPACAGEKTATASAETNKTGLPVKNQ